MSSRDQPTGGPTRLDRIRYTLGRWKPRLVKWLLALVAVLGVAAEIIEPLGDMLQGQQLLGGSFAALIALILFDAISESEPKEIPGVYVLADRRDLRTAFSEAFDARVVRIDFSGFTMETLIETLREPLEKMADTEVRTLELKLYIIIAHLNLPMSLPGSLVPAAGQEGTSEETFHFADSPENRRRMRDDFTRLNWTILKHLLDRVQERNPRISIHCEVRESPHMPERKLYILNQQQVFYTPYGIADRIVTWHDEEYRILDTEGFGPLYGKARIIGWDLRSKSPSTRAIAEHHMEWHRNLWNKLGYIKPATPVITEPEWVSAHSGPHS